MVDSDKGVIRFVQIIMQHEHSPKLLDITEVMFNNTLSLVQLLLIAYGSHNCWHNEN